MTTLFFMPWVASSTPLDLGSFSLIPFERKKLPGTWGGLTQDSFDGVLSRYGDLRYGLNGESAKPVRKATILWWKRDSLRTKLSAEKLAKRYSAAQLLSFTALSGRRFSQFQYYNSDTLTVIVQPFEPSRPAMLAIYARMRHGYSNNMIGSTPGVPIFMRPAHVENTPRIEIDVQFFHSLVGIRDDVLAQRIQTAVQLYLLANSDSVNVQPSAEMVFLRSAFETLLDCGHRAGELQKAFADHFRKTLGKPRWHRGRYSQKVWRSRWPKDVGRPLDAWVQDFAASRNSSAHGASTRGQHLPPIWNINNHLMFGSWLFPLVVKGILAEHGLYSINPLDNDFRSEFERFFARDIRRLVSFQKSAWDVVEQDIRLKDLARRMYPDWNLDGTV